MDDWLLFTLIVITLYGAMTGCLYIAARAEKYRLTQDDVGVLIIMVISLWAMMVMSFIQIALFFNAAVW